jgi:transcription elongation GreA/GreB family factor
MSIKKDKIYLSPEGVKIFEARLQAQKEAHAKICEEREIAHELSGDGWHDNPDFNRLQQLEANSTWKLKELEEVLNSAIRYEVVEGARPTDRVQLGAVCEVKMTNLDLDEEKTRVIELVGYEESDPLKDQVSYLAPLGKALIGATPEGDNIRYLMLPQGELELEVIRLFARHPKAPTQG